MSEIAIGWAFCVCTIDQQLSHWDITKVKECGLISGSMQQSDQNGSAKHSRLTFCQQHTQLTCLPSYPDKINIRHFVWNGASIQAHLSSFPLADILWALYQGLAAGCRVYHGCSGTHSVLGKYSLSDTDRCAQSLFPNFFFYCKNHCDIWTC